MTSHRLAAVATVTVLAATGLTACGSSSDSASGSASSSSAASSSAAPSSAAPSSADPSSAAPSASSSSSASAKAAVITIKDYKYVGASSVAPGTKVTVKNADSEAHTVTTDAGKDFDVTVPPGASATFTAPAKAGAYTYHCTYHSNMHASLTVS